MDPSDLYVETAAQRLRIALKCAGISSPVHDWESLSEDRRERHRSAIRFLHEAGYLITSRDVEGEEFSGPQKPKVVCLTGSTRFLEQYALSMAEESLKGHIVLTVAFPTSSENNVVTVTQKKALDELHLRKIDLSDEVLVLNVGGYIGPSTAREIDYALTHSKPVRFLEPAEHVRS